LALYPGYEEPGPSALPRGPEMVPPSAYPRLLATFNSGFYEKDAPEGFYVNHTLYFPMVKGQRQSFATPTAPWISRRGKGVRVRVPRL
jgi:hypothetical protein